MKLKYFVAGAAILMAARGASANMLYDFYVGATAGLGGAALFVDDHASSQGAQSYGAIAGVDIPLVRLEAEYNYLTAHDDTLQVVLLDAYLKMPSALLQPYIGAGVGWVFDGHVNGFDAETTATYQGMLGLSFNPPVLPLAIDIEGRVIYIPDVIEIAADNTEPDVLRYEGRVKLRYVF